jgi:hypothetical protein
MEKSIFLRLFIVLAWGGSLLTPPDASAQSFPCIDSFSPAFGEPGTQVTINGFFSTSVTTSVSFGSGGSLSQFTIVSSSKIIATVPNTAQTGPISITQGFTANSASQFAVAPRIESFERQGNPQVAFAAIGDSVQVEGANFVFGLTSLKVGGTAATAVSVTAPSQLFFTVPAGAVTGPLTVQTAAGLFTTPSNLVVTGSAVITGFSPTNGVGGTQVTLDGGDFTGTTSVTFNGVAVQFNVTSASQIIAIAPTNAGSGPIVITTPNGSAASNIPFDSVSLAPVITGFNPASGKAGDPIVIQGLNFADVTNVTFNGTNAQFGVTANDQINAIVPAGVSSGPITLFNSHGSNSSATPFGIEPVLSTFAPNAGTVGTIVTLNGLNLSEVTNVTFAGTSAAFTRTGPDQIQTAVPFGATNGSISVIAPFGSSTATEIFTVTFGIPLITGFTPTNGLSGSEITLTGIHFSGVSNVTFNGQPAASFGVTSDSQITAFTPGDGRTGPIAVFGPAGTNQSTNLFHFAPRVDSFTPSRGGAATPIVITGTNFTGATEIDFTGANLTKIPASFTVDHSGKITALTPTNIVNGPLTITTPGGKYITTTEFTILPRLDTFTPRLAPVGSTIAVTGQNFEKIGNVRFNGVNANFTFINSSNLTTVVPVTATGPISFRATENDIITSAEIFTVTAPTDLRVSQFNLPGIALENEPVDILISLTNSGSSIATEVTLIHTLASPFTIQSVETTRGTCVVSNRTVTCDVGILTNGHEARFTVKVIAITSGSHSSVIDVTAREGDPDRSNNSSTLLVPVVRDSDRFLSIKDLGNQAVELRWNFSSAQYDLQATATLPNSGIPWLTITDGVFNLTQNLAIFHVYTNQLTQPVRFFRLSRE